MAIEFNPSQGSSPKAQARTVDDAAPNTGDVSQAAHEKTCGLPQEDVVNLTLTAERLRTLEAEIKDLPDVDEAKVAAVRDRIIHGMYQIDAERLADKLLDAEGRNS